MADNRIAKGIVLVPCLLLGGAFLATAVWGQGAAADNRGLAAVIGSALILGGLLAQGFTDRSDPVDPDGTDQST
ncbi:MAG: GIVxVP protein [Synechococcus sp.]|nr:GIVxVP protein [Synechococcus sp.]